MSLRAIAKELEISPAYLSYMINGKRPWRSDLYDRYRQVVNTRIDSVNTSDVVSDTKKRARSVRYLHGVQGVARSNRAAPTKTQTQSVNTSYGRGVNSIFLSNPDLNLESVRDIFIRSSVHQSPKTISTLSERLRPFTAYLIGMGIHDPLRIIREHVDGFLIEIAKGRRGKPLSLLATSKSVPLLLRRDQRDVAVL